MPNKKRTPFTKRIKTRSATNPDEPEDKRRAKNNNLALQIPNMFNNRPVTRNDITRKTRGESENAPLGRSGGGAAERGPKNRGKKQRDSPIYQVAELWGLDTPTHLSIEMLRSKTILRGTK